MPKKPKKDDPNKVEERWVEWSDLENGVHLKAGHPVILFLGGHHGGPGGETTAPPAGETTAPPAGETTAPPAGETTAPPAGETTSPPTGETTQPPAGETTAPPPTTTTHYEPGTTTTPTPPGTTTNPPTTTTRYEPGPTTSQAPTTTTRAPSTTTHPPTTTTHAPTTTTHAPTTTTHAPPATTTLKKGKRYKLSADHFDNAKAFPKPEAAAFDTYKKVAAVVNADSTAQILILGHTDTKASDKYNLALSAERAASVKAYLINNVDAWYPYYSHTDPQKKWGLLEDQYMLTALPDGGDPYYKREPNGVSNADFTAALKKFQADAGEPATGTVNQATRKKLIAAYMALEGTSVNDKNTTIETKGCSFRNQAEDPPTGANVDSPTNRRTEIYVFFGDITPPASAWSATDKKTNAPTYAAWLANTDDDSL